MTTTNAEVREALAAAGLTKAHLAARLGRTARSLAATLRRGDKAAAAEVLQALRELVPTQPLNGHAAAPGPGLPAGDELGTAPSAETDDEGQGVGKGVGEGEGDELPWQDVVRHAVARLAVLPVLDYELEVADEVARLRAAGAGAITKTALGRMVADERKRLAERDKAARRERRRQQAAGAGDADDRFAPLTDEERGKAEGEQGQGGAGEFVSMPVPADAPAPPKRHRELGKPSRRFAYRDAGGGLLGYVERYETAEGKQLRPLFWGSLNGEAPRWHRRYPLPPRPLFGLDLLATRPGVPVLLAEGEKAAEAARELLGDAFVCIASPCGASAAGTMDWSPLAGRDATVWPDRDEAGTKYATKVLGLLHRQGAARVRVVEVPEAWPEGWDLSDELPDGVAPDDIRRMLAKAPERRTPFEQQGSFRVVHERHRDAERGQTLEPGVYRLVEKRDEDGAAEEWRRIGSLVEVVADTRDGDGHEWGRLVAVHDRDRRRHELAIPMELFAGDGAEYRAELLRRGFDLAAGLRARTDLHDFLVSWRPALAARCVDRCGWHEGAFVLPDRVVGPQPERVVLQAPRPPKRQARGTLDGWRSEVAALAPGNSRLVFAVCLGLAGPLLLLAGETSGGFTEVGPSSIGKSTLLRVAASVGGVELLTWRATSNGLEAVAAAHNDLTLVVDEMGQANAADLEASAYMLGNERGKARMQRTIAARPGLTWRLALYASGEVGLAARLGEAGRRARAGQEVRLVDLAADAGLGLGVFEEPHGHADGDALARHLQGATEANQGTALVAFLERLAADVEGSRALLREGRERFAGAVAPAGADGQVRRVAGRLALVAAGGELATAFGVTGWPEGTALAAVERRFREWLEARGGAGAAEDREALRQVRRFLELHGMARFEPAWDNEEEAEAAKKHGREPREVRVPNRAGFRRLTEQAGSSKDHGECSEDDEAWSYHVLPEVWRDEVCKGFEPTRVARLLADKEMLRPGDGNNLARKERIPGVGPTRVYVLNPSILTGEGS